ncbi:hypothetical protein ACS0TY_035869 [Phlomoides rotata]
MAKEASVSNSVDPLRGLNGPSLFPRTIRASANVPVPSDLKDLDSIHSFMKSLNVRSPQKLMNEAKKIVDGGAELLEYNLAGFNKNVSITNAIAAKGKDKPQDRRPALGLGRKRAPFSLKARFSQPSANLVPTFDIDQLEDPDEFFDVFERNEYAKKEIQKQLGGSTDNVNLYEPSNKQRVRRPGILGKTYKYKHRFSSTPAKIDELWMSSQETESQDIPSAHKDSSQEKLVHPDPNPDADLEETEPASTKKTVSMLEELLSNNMEDLEGHGALNLLQDHLNIMPLDIENLCMTELPDVGRTSILTASESRKKPRKSSVDIDSVLKNLSRKRHTEQEPGANPIDPVSSPTPPRSPFISLLKKKFLQPNPMIDPFSPLNIDHSSCPNASPSQNKDKIISDVDAHHYMSMPSELESPVEFCNPEPSVSDMYTQEVMGNADFCPEQFVDERASIQRANTNSRPNASPAYPKDKLLGQVEAPKDLDMPSELESHVEVGNTEPEVSNMDAQEVVGDADSLPEQSVDENASIQRNADIRPNEESDNNIGKPMNVNVDESNPPVFEEEARVDTSNRWQIDQDQSLEVPAAKRQRGKRVAGEKHIRKAHPMRRSLAEAGTTFENGVRRSKRIRSRPLEFWKGERFVFGRVDNSVKLIGVKCFSPGEGTEKLKVKPYISMKTTANKEILELAARH